MIQNLWQKKLKLSYNKEVFDIVQFGSSMIKESKPNDIDVAVIFKKIPLAEQLGQAQEIKKQLQKETILPLHIKAFDLYSFFDNSNFAKENLLFYGKSLISKDSFSKNFGLNSVIQISYSLKGLKKKDKIKFNYMLNGKKGKYGLLREYKGKLIAPGLIEISPEYEKLFINAIKKLTQSFKARRILF